MANRDQLRKGRSCAICGKQRDEGCATFLGLLIRWGFFNPPTKVNQFAHPSCVAKEQKRRRAIPETIQRTEGTTIQSSAENKPLDSEGK